MPTVTDETYYTSVVNAVRAVTTDPVILEPIIDILTAWVRQWPSENFKIVATEQQFALPMTDLRNRKFYFAGKIDLVGELPNGSLFVHDAKSHRGPWKKSQSIDDCLEDFWLDWHQNIQTRLYTYAIGQLYPGRTLAGSFLIRVGVKPGTYNQADVRERWFPATHVDRAVYGLEASMTHLLDLREQIDPYYYPVSDSACVDKYHRLCPFWNLCTAGDKRGLTENRLVDYLPIVNTLDAPWIDVSHLRMFRDCPRKYYHGRVLGLQPPTPDYFIKGHAFHAGLEAHYNWIKAHEVRI